MNILLTDIASETIKKQAEDTGNPIPNPGDKDFLPSDFNVLSIEQNDKRNFRNAFVVAALVSVIFVSFLFVNNKVSVNFLVEPAPKKISSTIVPEMTNPVVSTDVSSETRIQTLNEPPKIVELSPMILKPIVLPNMYKKEKENTFGVLADADLVDKVEEKLTVSRSTPKKPAKPLETRCRGTFDGRKVVMEEGDILFSTTGSIACERKGGRLVVVKHERE